MGKEPEDFKVVDRRHSSETPSDSSEKSAGEGFTMKESQETETPVGDVDFSTLVFSFATGALINLGLAPDPVTKKVTKNLELAKQNIDILNLLESKTRGNLTSDEKQLFENLLTEVRLKFVQASK